MKEKLLKIYSLLDSRIILRLFASWCFSSFVMLIATGCDFEKLENYSATGFLPVLIVFAVSFGFFTLLKVLKKSIETDVILLPAFFGLYTLMISLETESWYSLFALSACWALLLFYYSKKGYLHTETTITRKKLKVYVVLFFAFFALSVGTIGVFRYLTFSSPNYDFGIFCNMFYNMKAHFTPVTACERDTLLSHFAVHISPIYYVLLPLFFIFPSGITLQLSQSILLASGVFPLALICKKYGFSNIKTLVVSGIFCLSPVLASGTYYDFHENCFLVPCLLWMFYFFEKEKYIPFGIFTALTLFVKEDAAVYVVFFALYMIFDRKKIAAGGITAVCAVAYFAAVTAILAHIGDGVMSDRYSNFIVGDGGLVEMIKNVIADPAYVFSQLFTDDGDTYSEKILYIMQMVLPLGLLPFAAKKPSRYILLLPMLLVNLMTLYVYQYNIGYQYSFGTFAFLIYLSVISLSDMDGDWARTALSYAAVVSAMCFILSVVPKSMHYLEKFSDSHGEYAAMEEYLDAVPEDKSVVCTTFLLPHLADRDIIYEIEYHDPENSQPADVIIIESPSDYGEYIEQYRELGYEITDTLEYEGTELIITMEPVTPES